MNRYLLAAVTVLLMAADFGRTAEARRPNVVVVFIDDLGWGDFSCFGNEEVKTEHVDRLAAEGIAFEQFYVNAPICSPSRAALATGLYPQRLKVTSFLASRSENDRRGMAQWLDPATPMLARALKEKGYATGHFGKWHLGGQRDVGDAPLIGEYGFDASLTNFEGLGPRVLPLGDAHDGKPPVRHALGSDKLGRGPVAWEDRATVTRSFVRAGVDFMRKAEADGKPFFVNVWPDDVHSPFFPPEARRGDGAKRTLYLGVLKTMDEQLGELFDYIRRSPALRDNTLVLVCSDNGPEPGAGTAGPFRGTKGALYEGGIRSPLIAWGPGLIPAGRAGHRNASSVFFAADIAPSVLTLTGAAAPPGVALDGQDLSPTLLGKADASRKAPLFFRRPPDRPGTKQEPLPDLAVRAGNWKLLCQYDGSGPELYDLAADRGETTNVAGANPGVVRDLIAAVLDWHRTMPPDAGPAIEAAPAGPPMKGKGKKAAAVGAAR